MPLGLDQPYWIEDPDFDIEYHVRELALPEPGDDRQLAEQAARLHARPLDRRRPLWELYLIHGLSGGRKAVYSKVHHAAIDGVSGNDILAAVLDLHPRGPPEDADAAAAGTGDAVPGDARCWPAAPCRSPGTRCGPRGCPTAWRARCPGSPPPSPGRACRSSTGCSAATARSCSPAPGFRAPATPFNRSVSPHRRWAFRSLPLADVKTVKNAAGLHRQRRRHGAVDRARCGAGCSTTTPCPTPRWSRRAGLGAQRGGAGPGRQPGVDDVRPDPDERRRPAGPAARPAPTRCARAKEQHGALPADLLATSRSSPRPRSPGRPRGSPPGVRLVERLNAFNLIISNVPGPNLPLYYAGARMLAYYPLSAIADGQGLNITVMSLEGKLHFGLIADRELVPDLDAMAGYLADELDDAARGDGVRPSA